MAQKVFIINQTWIFWGQHKTFKTQIHIMLTHNFKELGKRKCTVKIINLYLNLINDTNKINQLENVWFIFQSSHFKKNILICNY